MIHDSRIKFAFFGTDDFSLTILEELKKDGLLPTVIVTVPDRPKGRGLKLTPPPAKVWAAQNSIPVLQPERLDSSFDTKLSTRNLELFVVASYGLIIPKEVLEIPPKGTLNVHPSLLPKYRGATPIESQILNSEKELGVSIMQMDEKMDHGPILAKRVLENYNPNIKISKASELKKLLAEKGGELLAETLPMWISGKIKAREQDHSKATYTKKFSKIDGEVDISGDAYKNFLKIRAFDDSIGAYFFAEKAGRKTRVIIKDAEFNDGKIEILKVIPEGKREMSYREFSRGFNDKK